MTPFWMIWNTRHPWRPKFRHESLEAAQTEAARLAETSPYDTFVLMASVETVGPKLTGPRPEPEKKAAPASKSVERREAVQKPATTLGQIRKQKAGGST
jgi:hypothetical protein